MTHDQILDAYMSADGNLQAAATSLAIPVHRLVALLSDPALAEPLAQWKSLILTETKVHALREQAHAAAFLRESIASSADPILRLRAATALARLATLMAAATKADRPTRPARREPDSPTPNPRPTPTFPPITLDDVLAEMKVGGTALQSSGLLRTTPSTSNQPGANQPPITSATDPSS